MLKSAVDAAIRFFIQNNLDRDGFKYLACGTRPEHEVTWPLVIVLDNDNNLEGLKLERAVVDSLGRRPEYSESAGYPWRVVS